MPSVGKLAAALKAWMVLENPGSPCISRGYSGFKALRLFQELYYMVHTGNVRSIAERGILSHRGVRQNGLECVDISDPGAQRWRSLPEPVFGRPVHAYVPLYFNPRNPMLFVRRHLQHALAILCLSPAVLESAGRVLYTDGNAASRSTQFSTDSALVETVRPVLESNYWADFNDGRRMRCAEALVLDRIEPHFIQRVACNNLAHAHALEWACDLPVEIDKSLFF